MIKMKKTAALLTALFMMFLCGWTQGENLQDRSVPATEEYVKLTGRTVSENGICWMIHSGSTLGFRFTGTKVATAVIGKKYMATFRRVMDAAAKESRDLEVSFED